MSENTQVMTLSEEIEALKAQILQKESVANNALVTAGESFFEELFGVNTVKPSTAKDSTWVGFVQVVEIERDGKPFHVKVTVTDTQASDKAKVDKAETAKAQRELAKLQEKHGALLEKIAAPAAS